MDLEVEGGEAEAEVVRRMTALRRAMYFCRDTQKSLRKRMYEGISNNCTVKCGIVHMGSFRASLC